MEPFARVVSQSCGPENELGASHSSREDTTWEQFCWFFWFCCF